MNPSGPAPLRIVFNRNLTIVCSIAVVCVTASWTLLVALGKIPPTIPEWSAPLSGIGGFAVGALVPLVRYLRDHGVSASSNGQPNDDAGEGKA
jgi:hypothetical protein